MVKLSKKLHFPKVRNLLTALPLIAAAFTSCSNEETEILARVKSLSFNVQTAAVEARSVIESATLPDKSSIGIFFAEDGKTTYDGMDYQNIQATAAGTGTSQTWTMDKDIFLSEKSGTLHAYYPYNKDVKDITQVPVLAGETDYMYATPATGLNYNNHETQLTMNHALTGIRLNIIRGTYTGPGVVKSISLQSPGIATGATMNATDGTLSAFTGEGEAVALTYSSQTQGQGQVITVKDLVIVPLTANTGKMEAVFILDDKEYTVSANNVNFQPGKLHTYDITLDNTQMDISKFVISDWKNQTGGSGFAYIANKVKLGGNMTNIGIHTTVGADGTLTIVAVPKYRSVPVKPVTCEQSVTLTQTLDTQTGVRTIVVKNITEETTIVFNGTGT